MKSHNIILSKWAFLTYLMNKSYKAISFDVDGFKSVDDQFQLRSMVVVFSKTKKYSKSFEAAPIIVHFIIQ